MQEQANKAESLVRLHNGIANAAEALGRLAGEELTGAQAEHLEEEAAAKVTLQDTTSLVHLNSKLKICPVSMIWRH